MTTPAEFYMSALALGFTSRRAKYLLGWTTAKGRTQAEYNAALKQLSDVLKEERKAGSR